MCKASGCQGPCITSKRVAELIDSTLDIVPIAQLPEGTKDWGTTPDVARTEP